MLFDLRHGGLCNRRSINNQRLVLLTRQPRQSDSAINRIRARALTHCNAVGGVAEAVRVAGVAVVDAVVVAVVVVLTGATPVRIL